MIRPDVIYICDACGKRVEWTEQVSAGIREALPECPYGWFKIENYLFCDEHQIKIDDRILTRSEGLAK